MQKPQEPLIHQKLVVRTAIFLFALAALVYGFNWIRTRGNDIDVGTTDTKGWIGALQLTRDSKTQAVVVKPDGTITPSNGYKPGSTDRDLVWRPDGNRIFFSSNRDDGAFNIYRWNLATDKVERRTFGKIAKAQPSFAFGEPVETERNPLMVYGGTAWELDPSDGKATQIAPTPTNDKDAKLDTNAEGGSESVLSYGTGAQYKAREARYFHGKDWIAVIRRTDFGDLLVAQKVGSADPKDKITLAEGDKIMIDVDPKSGKLFFTLLSFQWPNPDQIPAQFMKNGVATKPYEHIISSFNPDNTGQTQPVGASVRKELCFSQPAVSPDGNTLIVTLGAYKGNGEFEPRALISMPAADGGLRFGSQLYPPRGKMAGETIWNPHWSPDGSKICFGLVSADAKDHSICVIDKDGGNFKNLTEGKGSFMDPVFSPQQ